MNSILEKIKYIPRPSFQWQIPSQIYSRLSLGEVCEMCDSIKDKEIEDLKAKNAKLEKLVEFLRSEIKSLELKTALGEKAIPLKKIVKEFTSTPEGKTVWHEAWGERAKEWKKRVETQKISRVKYHRLINGLNQETLAKKLGTAQPNISRIERPGYNVPTKTLKALAKIFGVKLEELIGD